jgi:hypothetical protein
MTPAASHVVVENHELRFGLHPLGHAADRRTRTIPATAGPSPTRAARRS